MGVDGGDPRHGILGSDLPRTGFGGEAALYSVSIPSSGVFWGWGVGALRRF